MSQQATFHRTLFPPRRAVIISTDVDAYSDVGPSDSHSQIVATPGITFPKDMAGQAPQATPQELGARTRRTEGLDRGFARRHRLSVTLIVEVLVGCAPNCPATTVVLSA
jgi:hypothetical protein